MANKVSIYFNLKMYAAFECVHTLKLYYLTKKSKLIDNMLPRQVSSVTRYQIPSNHMRRTRVVRDVNILPRM